MQTVDFKINSHGLGMQGALDATEKLGAESGLTDKEILRLHSLGINNTRIAESCGCARSTVIAALQRAESLGLTWNAVQGLSESEVSKRL